MGLEHAGTTRIVTSAWSLLRRRGRRSGLFSGPLLRRLARFDIAFERARGLLAPGRYEASARFGGADYLTVAGFAAAGAVIALATQAALDAEVSRHWNIYFHADPNRVLVDMTERTSEQWRTGVHPIFPLLTYPLMHALIALVGDRIAAGEILTAACAGACAGCYYLALRGLGLPLAAACAFAAVLLGSATFVHWFAIVETYPFAAVSVTIMLLVLTAVSARVKGAWVGASALLLAITVTNWALALACAFFRLRLSAFVVTSIAAFALVAALALVQGAVFPNAHLFFRPYVYLQELGVTRVALAEEGITAWGPGDSLRSFAFASVVAPPPYVEEVQTVVGPFTLVNNQASRIASLPPLGAALSALWLLLLTGGAVEACRLKRLRPVALPVGAYVLFQAVLHVFYGEITFLYAGNYFPALVMIAAFNWFAPWRWIAVTAALLLAVVGGGYNFVQFLAAAEAANVIAAAAQSAP